jgi:hypothetical protein
MERYWWVSRLDDGDLYRDLGDGWRPYLMKVRFAEANRVIPETIAEEDYIHASTPPPDIESSLKVSVITEQEGGFDVDTYLVDLGGEVSLTNHFRTHRFEQAIDEAGPGVVEYRPEQNHPLGGTPNQHGGLALSIAGPPAEGAVRLHLDGFNGSGGAYWRAWYTDSDGARVGPERLRYPSGRVAEL